MKATQTYLAFFLLLALLPADAALAQCLRLTELRDGDFEVFVRDPMSPTSEVLMVNNDPNTGAVAVAKLNPITGGIVGSFQVIASDYQGNSYINGPEFVVAPEGAAIDIGVVYPGPAGVQGVFRDSSATHWYDFLWDQHGDSLGDDPKLDLSPTGPDIYPLAGYPDRVGSFCVSCTTSVWNQPPPSHSCYGDIDATHPDSLTDVETILEDTLHAPPLIVSAIAHHPKFKRGIAVSACQNNSPSPPSDCGIYRGEIDGSGGILSGFAAVQGAFPSGAPPEGGESLRGGVHPSSPNDDVIWFAADATHKIWVWMEDGTTHNLNDSPGHVQTRGSAFT